MKTFYFFCDGASEPTNPGPSAFAWTELATYHDKHEIRSFSQYIGTATNNIAELMAIQSVLQYIMDNQSDYLSDSSNVIYIYSDSMYALDCIRKWYPNWVLKRKLDDKKNLDIIKPTHENYARISMRVKVVLDWIKGHSGHWGNDRADELCEIAIANAQQAPQVKKKRKTKKDTIMELKVLTESLNRLIDEYEKKLGEIKKLQKTLNKK